MDTNKINLSISFSLLTVASVEQTYQTSLPYIEHIDNWKSLGTHQLPEEYIPRVINDIEKTHKGNVEECRWALLTKYLKSGEVSWNKVINSLEKSHYSNVAKMIKKAFLKTSLVLSLLATSNCKLHMFPSQIY